MPSHTSSPTRKRRARIHKHSSGKVNHFGFMHGKSVRKQKRSKKTTVARRLSFSKSRSKK